MLLLLLLLLLVVVVVVVLLLLLLKHFPAEHSRGHPVVQLCERIAYVADRLRGLRVWPID